MCQHYFTTIVDNFKLILPSYLNIIIPDNLLSSFRTPLKHYYIQNFFFVLYNLPAILICRYIQIIYRAIWWAPLISVFIVIFHLDSVWNDLFSVQVAKLLGLTISRSLNDSATSLFLQKNKGIAALQAEYALFFTKFVNIYVFFVLFVINLVCYVGFFRTIYPATLQ